MEEQILRIYDNHTKEIRKLSYENITCFHNYFRTEFRYQKLFLNQSENLDGIKDRKKIALIYKKMSIEIRRRLFY